MNKKPWEVDPRLKAENLQALARIIRDVRHQTIELYDPDRGDGPWSLGCRIYERTINTIDRSSKKEELTWLGVDRDRSHADAGQNRPPTKDFEWLETNRRDLAFLMLINEVPIKFYHGTVDDPPSRTLKIQYSELKKRQLLLFPDDDANWYWRIAVETLDDGRVDRIVIFQVNEAKDKRNQWEIDLNESAAESHKGKVRLTEAVIQPKPSVDLRSGIEKEGTADDEKQ